MKFLPKSEEEIQKEGLCKEGVYTYQVIKSEDKISQAGNEYTAITLKVWEENGTEHSIFTNMALIKLLKHFCDVNDLREEYKSGNVPAESFLYKSGGLVVIGIEPEKPNPKGGMFKAKNIVKDYIQDAKHSNINPLKQEVKNDFHDDDLPF